MVIILKLKKFKAKALNSKKFVVWTPKLRFFKKGAT